MATEEIKANWDSVKVKKYRAIHRWLAYHYGTAVKCENPDCDATNIKRYEWALKPNFQYQYKRENFKQLCCKCHKRMDYKPNYRTGLKKGSIRKARTAVKLTTFDGDILRYNSISEAAKKLNVSNTSIRNNIEGKTRNTKVGIWKELPTKEPNKA